MAQPVEQLTRNEQVVRSNRISSSNHRPRGRGYAAPGAFFMSSAFCGSLKRPGGAPRGVCLPHPPALPVGKGAGRCAPVLLRLVLLPNFLLSCVRGLCRRLFRRRSAFVCRQTPCRFVLRFPSFRPRTPCFCNPFMVSQERHNYVLSSVLKTYASTATSAKFSSISAFQDHRVRTVHFRSLAGAE